jgi:hypothetical protein
MATKDKLDTDCEKALDEPKVLPKQETAKFIAKEPDKTAAIYRRYDYLSNRSLLLLQSNLALLEEKLAEYDAKDLEKFKEYTAEGAMALRCSVSLRDFQKFGNLNSNLNDARPAESGLTPQQKKMKLALQILDNSTDGAGSAELELTPQQKKMKLALEILDDSTDGAGPAGSAETHLTLQQERWKLAREIQVALKEYRKFHCLETNEMLKRSL